MRGCCRTRLVDGDDVGRAGDVDAPVALWGAEDDVHPASTTTTRNTGEEVGRRKTAPDCVACSCW
jgi:hypothetical protein